MNIYKITRKSDVGYDECYSFVITADSPKTTRKSAAKYSGDEGPELWLNPKSSKVELIGQTSKTFKSKNGNVVLADYRNG